MTAKPQKAAQTHETQITFYNLIIFDTRCNDMLHAHLDFNLIEGLAVVHADHGSNHLRQDDHVSQVSLHHLWFLHRRRLLLGLAEALEERLLLPPEATVQPPPLSGAVQLHQLLTEEHTLQLIQHFYTSR